jgi:hypothetical protein
MKSLARLVPLYPTLNRASYPALSSLSLRFLNGSAPNPTSEALLEAASRLYTVLPFTGGKVGAANLWRKAVDETLAFGWSAFLALRTTFPEEGKKFWINITPIAFHLRIGRNIPHQLAISNESQIAVPFNLDRLRCCTVVLGDLLRCVTLSRSIRFLSDAQ